MDKGTFKAMVVTETEDGSFERSISDKSISALPEGDVLVKVLYSSLNYKDALSATGNRGVTKKYPHTTGIDAAGIVEESKSDDFRPGDKVIVTSYDLGMNTSGGHGEYIRVPAGWVVRLPEGLSFQESMVYGTAGLTACLSVFKLTNSGVTPEHGEVLVTGAPGGVGSVAVSVLAKLGYSVAAVNGLVDATDYLMGLGAKTVIPVDEASDESGRPLLKGRWAGVIDTVGGNILATAIKSAGQNGVVTCCGNAASPDLPMSVFPFILRGVSLLGIDSQNCEMAIRQQVWNKIAKEWKLNNLKELTSEITLEGLNEKIDLMLQGKSQGRTVVKIA